MKAYSHIDSVYKRDTRGKFMLGEYSTPEFEYLAHNPWVWTEKIDGTNIRIMFDGLTLTFGGKTDDSQIPSKLVNVLNGMFPDVAAFAAVFDRDTPATNVCLYGEGYGAGIQKAGGNYSLEQKFILFDVKVGDWWLLRKDIEDVAKKLNLDVVPLLEDNISLEYMVRDVAAFADNPPKSSIVGINPRQYPLVEGWVGQPQIPLFNRKGERVITKVKYKDFR